MRDMVPVAETIQSSSTAQLEPSDKCANKDVVLCENNDGTGFVACEVLMLFSVEGEPMALVNRFSFNAYDTPPISATWRKGHQPEVTHVLNILAPVIWTEVSSGVIRALIPFEYQGRHADVS